MISVCIGAVQKICQTVRRQVFGQCRWLKSKIPSRTGSEGFLKGIPLRNCVKFRLRFLSFFKKIIFSTALFSFVQYQNTRCHLRLYVVSEFP